MKAALILNRRCLRHPQRGGAESYTLEMAKALQDCGYQVQWLASEVAGASLEENVDGIRFIRRGNELTTHFYGLAYAIRTKPALVIDEFNGIGYGTFFMSNSMLLIHQLYAEFWRIELGVWGNLFKALERIFLKLYRNKPAITVSQSTCDDLRQLGFSNIILIHNSLEIEPLQSCPVKNKQLTLVYLGRIKKTKNPEDAIRAFLIVQKSVPDALLRIIGNGPLLPFLKRKYSDFKGISFHGFVDSKQKYELLTDAHLLLVPSIHEGWGQIVIQANAVGTPAIGFNVKGICDSIIDGETGLLADDFKEMAEQIIMLWNDSRKREALGRNALAWSRSFSHNKMRLDFQAFFNKVNYA